MEETKEGFALNFVKWIDSITWKNNIGCYRNETFGKYEKYNAYKLLPYKELLEIYIKEIKP